MFKLLVILRFRYHRKILYNLVPDNYKNMKTIVIIGGIILAGATIIAVVMDQRNEAAKPAISTQGTSALPAQVGGENLSLNPAHGQPGHRCDLAVGAPLTNADGTPVPAANPQNIQSKPVNPATVPSGLKVNPPHGQPGHRCDIQVGAPL